MKRNTRSARKDSMSADAYAGFLKLWVTPTNVVPMSPEVDAYLRYSNQSEPLSADARRVLGLPTRNAA